VVAEAVVAEAVVRFLCSVVCACPLVRPGRRVGGSLPDEVVDPGFMVDPGSVVDPVNPGSPRPARSTS
jgi:hypothetical protein